MEDVREALGIDKVDMSGKMIFIQEQHHADANFIPHAITSYCRDKNNIVCFVLFHHTFGHFHNVGMKLGYNLKKLCDTSVKVVEPLKLMTKNIHQHQSGTHCDGQKSVQLDLTSDNVNLVKQLAYIIKHECVTMRKEQDTQKVYIIIDDLSHLFDIGLSVQDVWLLIRYLRSLVSIEPQLILCIGSHVYRPIHEHCQPNTIAVALRCSADLVIEVRPLDTGHSRNVSGKMIVCWKSQQERLKFKWPEEQIHLFKLYDRQVKLFAPGSSCVM